MEVLFAGIPLADVTTSMTISGPAVPIFAMYVVAAERQGADISLLDGTLQTDIFKEYTAQKEWLFGPEPHLRLIGDLMEWVGANVPKYKPLSVSGYHIREAGSTAAQELAFTLADGFGYVELGLSRGLDVDEFAPGLSFFFDAHIDFFEEIAKFRAARRIWARWLRDEYGATTERAQWLRFHTQTAGVSLTAPQPDNNIVRTAIEALAAVLGGTNSLHTNALDEVLALPSEKAAQIALRTQQVIAEETGVANVADPLGGSWYVEALTDRIEAQAEAIFAQIRELGERRHPGEEHPIGPITSGLLAGIENGWFTDLIADAAFEHQRAVEEGRKRVVGVNVNTDAIETPLEILRVSHEVERTQVEQLAARRAARDSGAVEKSLAILAEAVADGHQPRPAAHRRRQGRGHARRDVRRAARRMGHLPRADLSVSRRPSPQAETLRPEGQTLPSGVEGLTRGGGSVRRVGVVLVARMVASVASTSTISTAGPGPGSGPGSRPAPTLIETSSGRRTAIADSSVMSSPANSTRRAGSVAISARSAEPLSSGRVDSSITSLPSRQNVPANSSARPRIRSSARSASASVHPRTWTARPAGLCSTRTPGMPPTASATLARTSASRVDSSSVRVRSAPTSWPCEPISVADVAGPTDRRQVLPCASGEQHDLRARGAGEPSHQLERARDRAGRPTARRRWARSSRRSRGPPAAGRRGPAGGERLAEVR